MRRRIVLLASLTSIWLVNEAYSVPLDRNLALRIVGGSSEEVNSSVYDEGKKRSASAFLRNSNTETKTGTDHDQIPETARYGKPENEEGAAVKKLRPRLHLGVGSSALEKIKTQVSRLLSSLGPALVALMQLFIASDRKTLMTKPAVYALALLGASSGFYLFLYFITVGYCCGVALPVLVALIVYNVNTRVPALTNIHSGLCILWGVRATWYFLYREYINWPQLHEKSIEVNKLARPLSKIFCWLMYSLFYVTLTIPFLCRLEGAYLESCTWKRFGFVAIGIQVTGLLLETIADQQKMAFKSQPGNRIRWCNVGLWKYSTHPNYLGEQLFWVGSFLGGLSCYRTRVNLFLAAFGLLFISAVLSGARISLGSKHLRKYGADIAFLEFRKTHSMWGPIPWRTAQDRQLVL